MNLELRFFASLREALGVSQESITIPAEVKTIADLRSYLAKRSDQWTAVLGNKKIIRCALNQQMVDANTPLEDDAEVAFFPPVTGG
jgi:molybdopterin synthase sulfur carrier subunit